MCPAAVTLVSRIVPVGVIVDCTDFVTEIEQRDAASSQDNTVDQQDTTDGNFNFIRPSLLDCSFQTSQGCACPTDTAITRFWILLKGQSTCEAACEAPQIKLIQKRAMIVTAHAKQGCIF